MTTSSFYGTERSAAADFLASIREVRSLAMGEDLVLGRLAAGGDSAQAQDARKQLAEAFLPLVVALSKPFLRGSNWNRLDELLSAGCEGLVMAARRFDPSHGNGFAAYARWWIRKYILEAVRDRQWLMHIPDQIYRDVLELREIDNELIASLGRPPNRLEFADATGWPAARIGRALAWKDERPISIDFGVFDHLTDGALTWSDGELPDPPTAVDSQLLREQVEDCLSSLSSRERRVLQLRFGLEDGRSRTLEEVGREFGVTDERIRQIEVQALRKMRHPARARTLRDYAESSRGN